MSTLNMYLRIQSAMPDDEEVQAFCRKYIDKHGAAEATKEEKLNNVRKALLSWSSKTDEGATAKDIAESLNAANIPNGDKMLWTTQGAGYYLRLLVKENMAEQIGEDKGPKKYSYIG